LNKEVYTSRNNEYIIKKKDIQKERPRQNEMRMKDRQKDRIIDGWMNR